VVVIPKHRGRLVITVFVRRRPGRPVALGALLGLAPELVVPGADPGKAGRDVRSIRQVPRLWIAVAVGRCVGTVQVNDCRNGAGVRRGIGGRGSAISTRHAAAGVGPVQRRIDRHDVRHVVSIAVDKSVRPRDEARPVLFRYERRPRPTERRPVARHAHAEDRGSGEAFGQHLLFKWCHHHVRFRCGSHDRREA
jgi:hypothetical protein